MPRLIDVPAGSDPGAPLAVRVGDVLAFAATGVRPGAGPPVLERLGAFVPAVVGLDGHVLAPEGAPSTVLVVARAAGRTTLDVVTGDPWRGPAATTYTIHVED